VYQNSRSEGFGEEVQRRILLGTMVLSRTQYDSYYKKAQQIRRLVKEDFERVFESTDVLLTPTAPTPAFPLGSITDPLTMYLNDVMTIPANLAGIPAISLPVALSQSGLPLAMQLMARRRGEKDLLLVSNALMKHEKTQQVVSRKPPLT